jgi:capsule biosynthesis phosphatase|tara:strand:+ start:30323 stop:30682 length:360 start_codon:yes stop_codon:yes gene_type:complete
MKISVDLDGTIAQNKVEGQDYEDVEPVPDAVRSLQKLKKEGFYIIIHTARNMGTCNNNIGQVIARQGKLVTNWLDTHRIPYDELLFGKPNVDYFIDDKGIGFKNWEDTTKILLDNKNNV